MTAHVSKLVVLKHIRLQTYEEGDRDMMKLHHVCSFFISLKQIQRESMKSKHRTTK